MGGLDPPAESDPALQHRNTTSKSLIKSIGSSDFDWFDCVLVHVIKGCLNDTAIDRAQNHRDFLKDPVAVLDYESRLAHRIREEDSVGNKSPILYLCGVVPNDAFTLFTRFKLIEINASLGLSLEECDGISCLIFKGHDHPCAGWQSQGDPVMMARNYNSRLLLKIVHETPFDGNSFPTYCDSVIAKLSAEARRVIERTQKLLEVMGVDDFSGGLDHMRHVAYNE